MKRCPKVGSHVSVKPSLTHGGFTGTVTKIYPQYRYDDVRDKCTDELLSESEWHVSVKVDSLPTPWPYPGTDLIAPQVSSLRKARTPRKGPALRPDGRSASKQERNHENHQT